MSERGDVGDGSHAVGASAGCAMGRGCGGMWQQVSAQGLC